MCAEPMLPGTVAEALEEYGRLLAEHGITWGEPEIHYVKFFARRRVLPPSLFGTFWRLAFEEAARLHPGQPIDRLAAHLAEPDYDRVLRDALAGELPSHLTALRVGPDRIELRGAPITVLTPGEPHSGPHSGAHSGPHSGPREVGAVPVADARPATAVEAPLSPSGRGAEKIFLLVDSSRDTPCPVSVDDVRRELAPTGPGWSRPTRAV
ncbi:hypothetical protein ACWEJ6_42960 [Nonomuraea sp. NPDC004702]